MLARELEGVVEEVDEDLHDTLLVADDLLVAEGLVVLKLEDDHLLLALVVVELNEDVDCLLESEGPPLVVELVALEGCEVEDVIDLIDEEVVLCGRVIDVLKHIWRGLVLGHLQHLDTAVEGCPELMGEGPQKGVLEEEVLLELFELLLLGDVLDEDKDDDVLVLHRVGGGLILDAGYNFDSDFFYFAIFGFKFVI